jgi:hypothetical protein
MVTGTNPGSPTEANACSGHRLQSVLSPKRYRMAIAVYVAKSLSIFSGYALYHSRFTNNIFTFYGIIQKDALI